MNVSGARLGRGAEQAVRPGHARQRAADQGPGHRDEDSGEPPPIADQGEVCLLYILPRYILLRTKENSDMTI